MKPIEQKINHALLDPAICYGRFHIIWTKPQTNQVITTQYGQKLSKGTGRTNNRKLPCQETHAAFGGEKTNR